ncbi:LysR substrate-binding domain-containing protein [Gordonia sp. (in: high G+C Gram-positive bacteria)]|uniref:LysR substrate-binding domain-containing protein n=1 Tax=Gordonia sp. (in: high G+C Gram-positive bacteria) TaxID=84139 RepID=UPI003C76B4C0
MDRGPDFALTAGAPVPLVLYPRPSLTRDAALDALTSMGRAHRTVATSGSLSGLRAAALGGLGILPFAASLIPDGLAELDTDLPALPPITFVLMTRSNHVPAATGALIDALRADHPHFAGSPGASL